MTREEKIFKKYGKNRPVHIYEDQNGNTVVYWLYDRLRSWYGLDDAVLKNCVK